MEITTGQKLGVGFGSFGIFFILLGVLLLFDQGKFAFEPWDGLSCCMGLEKTFAFFVQPERKLGSAAFLGGILVLLAGYPFIGMIIEAYGFVKLFGGLIPMAISFLRQVPVISLLLAMPGISEFCDSITNKS